MNEDEAELAHIYYSLQWSLFIGVARHPVAKIKLLQLNQD